MKKIIIFGTTEFEKRLKYYIELSSEDKVIGFCVDEYYKKSDFFCDQPVVAFEHIKNHVDPREVFFLVGIGYKNLNDLRKKKFIEFKDKGYHGYNLIHRTAYVDPSVVLGENNIILGNSFIDFGTHIGDCNIFENSVSISHNCQIGSYNYFSPRVVAGGKVLIKDSCFFGINSTLRSAISIQDKVVVGASAYVDRSVESTLVIVPPRSYKIDINSNEICLLYKGDKTWKK